MAGIGSIISPRGRRLRVLIPSAISLIWLLFAVVGCGGNSFDYVGTWEGQRDLKAKPGEDQLILNSLGKVKVIIHSTGGFEMFEGGLKKSGTIFFGSEKASMRVERIMDTPIQDYSASAAKNNGDIALIPQKDGTLSYQDPNGFDESPIILTRQSKP